MQSKATSTRNKKNDGKQLDNFRRMMNYITHFWQLKAVIILILFSTCLLYTSPSPRDS